jgi:hypothetical protein
MDKFVARENIRHFRDRLETETEPSARSLLRTLMVQEEDRFGHNSEALHEIEKLIARAKECVNRQKGAIASIERDGRDKAQALALLGAYSENLLAFENQREKILSRLQQSHP